MFRGYGNGGRQGEEGEGRRFSPFKRSFLTEQVRGLHVWSWAYGNETIRHNKGWNFISIWNYRLVT